MHACMHTCVTFVINAASAPSVMLGGVLHLYYTTLQSTTESGLCKSVHSWERVSEIQSIKGTESGGKL